MASLSRATAVTAAGSHTYKAHFPEEWAIGTVPNGGYVSSCFLSVAKAHFGSTLSSYNQPDTFVLHLEFLRRTSVGEALFKVRDLKLGRRTSTIQVALFQDSDTEEVVGYLTNTDLGSESGLSLNTNWSMYPPGPPPVDLTKLRGDSDTNWRLVTRLPFADFRKATKNVDIFLPRFKPPKVAIVDEILRLKNGERFHLESLGFVNDTFPQLVETLDSEHDQVPFGKNWYPTLVLNLDVKKSLPPEGVEFLFVRVQAIGVRNGRMDLQITIRDAGGDLVALGHHVSLILDASRNLAERRTSGRNDAGEDQKTKSKL